MAYFYWYVIELDLKTSDLHNVTDIYWNNGNDIPSMQAAVVAVKTPTKYKAKRMVIFTSKNRNITSITMYSTTMHRILCHQ
jgi:hypothetical protein